MDALYDKATGKTIPLYETVEQNPENSATPFDQYLQSEQNAPIATNQQLENIWLNRYLDREDEWLKRQLQHNANKRFNHQLDLAALGALFAPVLGIAGAEVAPFLAPGTVGGTLIGETAGGMAMGELLNKGTEMLTGRNWGDNVRHTLENTFGYNPESWSWGQGAYNLATDMTNPGYWTGSSGLKSVANNIGEIGAAVKYPFTKWGDNVLLRGAQVLGHTSAAGNPIPDAMDGIKTIIKNKDFKRGLGVGQYILTGLGKKNPQFTSLTKYPQLGSYTGALEGSYHMQQGPVDYVFQTDPWLSRLLLKPFGKSPQTPELNPKYFHYIGNTSDTPMSYKVGEKEIPAFVFTDNPLEAKTTAEKIFNWKSTPYGQPKMNVEDPMHAWNETAGDIRIDNGDIQLYYNGKAGDIMELRPEIGESRMVYGDTYDFGEDYVNKYLKNTSPIIQKLALRLSNLTHPITVFSPDMPFYGMP